MKQAGWRKLGRILAPDTNLRWLVSHVGASFADPSPGDTAVRLFITGRDAKNRSMIGTAVLSLEGEKATILQIDREPLVECGELGAFDENGVSYPWLVRTAGTERLYYTGWMPSVLTPFQNHLGVGVMADGQFRRLSRAPILPRTDDDPFSIGSACVLVEGAQWKMWYTAFTGWDNTGGTATHRYLIKYATSTDGLAWHRDNTICIDFKDGAEQCIAKPAVIKAGGMYHMWFSRRGAQYTIGYATSHDGTRWNRDDDRAGIACSPEGFDSASVCYPHVFAMNGVYYMLYCGNDYGREGLGIAVRESLP